MKMDDEDAQQTWTTQTNLTIYADMLYERRSALGTWHLAIPRLDSSKTGYNLESMHTLVISRLL